MFSEYLKSRHNICKELVNRLDKYPYVSLLGRHVVTKAITVTSQITSIGSTGEQECGFVVKIYNGKFYSEYSFSDIDENSIDSLINKIETSLLIDEKLGNNHVESGIMKDEPLKKDFVRLMEGKNYTSEEIVSSLNKIKEKTHQYSDKIVQMYSAISYKDISTMFISKNRDLTQNYFYCNGSIAVVSREESNIKQAYDSFGANSIEDCISYLNDHVESTCSLALELLHAELITPGVYDIITDPSITGLIAHEAFGHGVEMDMYVKNRALSKEYINKQVASELIDMHDGAKSVLSAASYFFDDDGVLAHDTLIIKKGILQTGISDALSALQLHTEPTGNSRRESFARKAYTRMTNTFFSKGTDKLEDMIKSIKYGYMLFQTSNGMEDPKNWNIQCVAQYGREIKDGKFTGKIVSPVCMSGYVPDLLKSITMVSDSFNVIGAGFCGKGHKEWVPVSDGGPHLKARCKLG